MGRPCRHPPRNGTAAAHADDDRHTGPGIHHGGEAHQGVAARRHVPARRTRRSCRQTAFRLTGRQRCPCRTTRSGGGGAGVVPGCRPHRDVSRDALDDAAAHGYRGSARRRHGADACDARPRRRHRLAARRGPTDVRGHSRLPRRGGRRHRPRIAAAGRRRPNPAPCHRILELCFPASRRKSPKNPRN